MQGRSAVPRTAGAPAGIGERSGVVLRLLPGGAVDVGPVPGRRRGETPVDAARRRHPAGSRRAPVARPLVPPAAAGPRTVRGTTPVRGATPARPPLRLTARGRRVVAVAALAGAVGSWALAGATLGGDPDRFRLAGESSVVVEAGDTLWSIASSVAGEERDVRQVIDEIQRANGLDGATLVPGQVLALP